MMKQKRKLTLQRKFENESRKNEFMYVFMNGKQLRVKRPSMIDGISVDEFIRNADPIWLHQNGMWELIEDTETRQNDSCSHFVDSVTDFKNPIPNEFRRINK